MYPKPYPKHFLKQYKDAGTIYTKDVNDSLKVSNHTQSTFGKQQNLFIWSDPNITKPCQVFSQFYILENANGRFTSPDGKRYDLSLHCRYL